ncbi:FG-GAP repeat domain-containing protein [Kordia sp.]|uniref:FG-GAP repeat domain-containing protein n=1 Tax=Kordia sp. TaxID=1965332 RepID=UPI003D2D3C61
MAKTVRRVFDAENFLNKLDKNRVHCKSRTAYTNLNFKLYLAISLLIFFLTNNVAAQGSFEQIAVKNNGVQNTQSQLGNNGWTLRSQDKIAQVGKFNFVGRSEFIIQGQSGFGIIALDANNEFVTIVQAENGTAIRGFSRRPSWTVSTHDNVLGVGHFHPNYKYDILLQNDSRLGILSLNNNSDLLTTHTIANNEYFEGWRYKKTDQILGIGNFNNDSKSDFIIKSYSHLGIISVDNNGNFTAITSGVRNSYLGNSFWKFKPTDEILGVGDFNEDNRSDFIIKSDTNLSILSLDEQNNFTRVAIGTRDQYLGDSFWRYKATDEILGVGDFDGDERSDFIIKSQTNLSILSVNDSGDFTRVTIGQVGQYLGDSFWRFKTTDRILGIGDFNGDGHSDFIIQSNTHIGIIGVNAAGKFFSIAIMGRNTAFTNTTSFVGLNNYKVTGDFNVDQRSDFIIKDNNALRIFTFKQDINRFLNIDDCADCTTTQNDRLITVMGEMLGIDGGDPIGDFISTAVALKPVVWGRNWYPIRGTREILCGTLESYGVTEGVFDNIRGAREFDWNININPNPIFERLIDEVRPYRERSDNEWKTCNGEPCMEAEVTPPTALNDFHYFMTEEDRTFLIEGEQQICVYGPWVREEVHGNRPEIHPSELLWWENANGSKVMVIVKDASNRFGESNNFKDKPEIFIPWASGPMVKQFKIAFSVEVGAETEQYTLDIGRKHLANTFKNESISKDVLAGRRYGLEKNGQIPILVIESVKADRYLGVTFDSVCYNAETNRLQGYILVKAQIGNRDALGAFLEIKLTKQTTTVRR